MTLSAVIPAVTCLGCGCTCDDIVITVNDGLIVGAERACDRGVRWFGSGAAPARTLAAGVEISSDDAVHRAALMLRHARRPAIVLAPDVSCETYAEAVGC